MKKDIVSRIAYLIGVREIKLTYFDIDIIKFMKSSNDCLLIRRLCQLRTKLLKTYYDIKKELKEHNGRISLLEDYKFYYDSLYNKYGIDIDIYEGSVKEYIEKINKEIKEKIDNVAPLFPSVIDENVWTYIRNLFIFPDIDIVTERNTFMEKIYFYPYGCYINWTPKASANILTSDSKILTILFEMNGKTYEKTTDDMLSDLYDFIEKNKKTIIAVDCENVDYALFYTFLNQIDNEIAEKIIKVILFNDPEQKSEWNFYESPVPIEFQNVECSRIIKGKSTVDVKMSAFITAAHYKDDVDGIILASSDSDYWGLIEALDTAKFYILCEREKMSSKNIIALNSHQIPYYRLDEFLDESICKEIKETTYKNEIKQVLSQTKFSVDHFLEKLNNYTEYLSDNDKELYRQTICKLHITFNEDGKPNYDF